MKKKCAKKPRKTLDHEELVSGDHFEFEIPKVGDIDLGSHMCCDCLLVHRWEVEKLKGGKVRIRVYRDDYMTEKARKGKR